MLALSALKPIMVLEARAVLCTSPICRLAVPVKGRSARDALPHTFNIGVFKCSKYNSITIECIYNES